MSIRLKNLVVPAGLLLLVFCLYHQVVTFPFVRWDDGLLIYENPKVWGISFANLKAIFTSYDPELYIPLTLFTYQIDYMLSSHTASFYHFHNLLWHGLASGAVYFFCLQLTGRKLIAGITACLFAIHPLNTEAAVWASARKDVVSTTFFFGSLGLWLLYTKTSIRKWYWLCTLCLLLALLAKATYVVFPAAVLLLDYLKNTPVRRQRMVDMITPTVLCIVFLIIGLMGKQGVEAVTSPWETILLAPHALRFYVQKVFIPIGFSVIYPFSGTVSLLHPAILISWILCAVATVASIFLSKRTRWPLFALCFYILCTLPTTINIKKGELMNLAFASDRYAYAGSVGIFVFIALLGAWLYENHHQYKRMIHSLTGILFILLFCLSFKQALTWKSSPALFGNVIQHYPEAIVAHNNLGNFYREQGNVRAAIERYESGMRIVDGNSSLIESEASKRGYSKLVGNYAAAIRQTGDTSKSSVLYDQALELDAGNYLAHLGKGILAASSAHYVEAAEYYDAAIKHKPSSPSALVNRGALHVTMGEIDKGIALYENAIAVNPFFPQAYYNLGIALQKINKPRQAREQYEQAVTLVPQFTAARINLGILYAERTWTDKAIEQFEAILQYDPQNARALSALQQLQS